MGRGRASPSGATRPRSPDRRCRRRSSAARRPRRSARSSPAEAMRRPSALRRHSTAPRGRSARAGSASSRPRRATAVVAGQRRHPAVGGGPPLIPRVPADRRRAVPSSHAGVREGPSRCGRRGPRRVRFHIRVSAAATSDQHRARDAIRIVGGRREIASGQRTAFTVQPWPVRGKLVARLDVERARCGGRRWRGAPSGRTPGPPIRWPGLRRPRASARRAVPSSGRRDALSVWAPPPFTCRVPGCGRAARHVLDAGGPSKDAVTMRVRPGSATPFTSSAPQRRGSVRSQRPPRSPIARGRYTNPRRAGHRVHQRRVLRPRLRRRRRS
jgi:hypothetical protein